MSELLRFWYTLAFDENGNSGKQTLGLLVSKQGWVYGIMARFVVETSEIAEWVALMAFFVKERGAEC